MKCSESDYFRSAFDVLLRSCLCLDSSDEVVVVFDDSMLPYFPSFTAAARDACLSVTYVYLPLDEQLDLSGTRDRHPHLPAGLQAAISASNGLVTFIVPGEKTLPVRKALVRQGRPGNCRMIHLPGITDAVLNVLATSDISAIREKCETLAWILGEARDLVVETKDLTDEPYSLNLRLGGWDNEPLLSPGVIAPGGWGNAPPGESFICPNRGGAEGKVFLDGSVPGSRVPEGCGFLLEFRKGRLVSWHPTGTFDGSDFFDRARSKADLEEDKDWCQVAELGIGANPVITTLTGNAVLDEKADRTAHIAIGDNTVFGHDSKANVHHDLVFHKPTLQVNNWTPIVRGCLELDEVRKWKNSVHAALAPVNVNSRVRLRPNRCRATNERFYRRLARADRVDEFTLTDGPLATALCDLISELRTYDEITVSSFLEDHPSLGGLKCDSLLAYLHHYRILTARKPSRRRYYHDQGR